MNVSTSIPVITLDGPSGTGKGTLCHKLAHHLNWHLLDSGCIYRVLAYAAQKNNIAVTDISALVALAHSLNVKFITDPQKPYAIVLDGINVLKEIRSEYCGQNASKIGELIEVRTALLARQRAFAQAPGLVTDGRDMGTVVFPEAILKIFLYAAPEIRAERRYLQLKESGIDVSLAAVISELTARDLRDTQRACAPLKPAADAILIDTTGISIVQVFNNVLELIKKCGFVVEQGEV